MVFAKQLREGVRRGSITSTVRIWRSLRVKVGNFYRMEEGQIQIDSVEEIRIREITQEWAEEAGFASVKDLLQVAKHGAGEKVFLIRFYYLA